MPEAPRGRGRGSPKKSAAAETRLETEPQTKPNGVSAREARARRRHPELYRFKLQEYSEETPVLYRPGLRPYNTEEDQVETVMASFGYNPAHWWARPPAINYQIMEEEDWQFPAWENWVEHRRENLERAYNPAQLQEAIEELLAQGIENSSSESSFEEEDTAPQGEEREHQERHWEGTEKELGRKREGNRKELGRNR